MGLNEPTNLEQQMTPILARYIETGKLAWRQRRRLRLFLAARTLAELEHVCQNTALPMEVAEEEKDGHAFR